MDQVSVPFVILGLPRLVNLLQVNEQLRRRFPRRRHLEMGQGGETNVETECLSLFIALGETLPFNFPPGEGGWPELAKRIYFACDGRVAYVKMLLGGAIRVAVSLGESQIDRKTLEEAFREEIWMDCTETLNPFNDKFKFRPLTQVGEPFEKTGLAGRRAK